MLDSEEMLLSIAQRHFGKQFSTEELQPGLFGIFELDPWQIFFGEFLDQVQIVEQTHILMLITPLFLLHLSRSKLNLLRSCELRVVIDINH